MDYSMIYAIKLHKHIKTVSEMIQAIEMGSESDIKPLPPMPEAHNIVRKNVPNGLNFIPKNTRYIYCQKILQKNQLIMIILVFLRLALEKNNLNFLKK